MCYRDPHPCEGVGLGAVIVIVGAAVHGPMTVHNDPGVHSPGCRAASCLQYVCYFEGTFYNETTSTYILRMK